MSVFVNFSALMSAPASANTDAVQLEPQVHY